jgi:hypothetical protein
MGFLAKIEKYIQFGVWLPFLQLYFIWYDDQKGRSV